MSDTLHPEAAILNAALELEPADRAAYLDQACAGDAALRQQVEALLTAHEQAEGFLDAPPAGLDFHRTVRVNVPLTEKPGDKIGRYKLLQQIGEGGCGVVYMAEQEEPVRRRVALKVIKLGMDTKQVIARFEAERQALALMDHPNIAKVFDAGATETGRPYFVMELVRGIKITDFCDENKLSTEERLKLFIQVCQAIQHAHQKGVIHRDIKPSNILVTINDGVPVPKVIDFGIAKATAGRLTDQTLFTAFEQFIGTPAYMSPEQAVMTSLDIDTRSDLYSLGVLLYELLTGGPPFDQKELLAAGLDEMRRTIREQEPLKPSTRLRTMAADALTTTAERRHTDAPKLIHLLRGDLDWIVMKCLEKDRARRYETANGLAMDVQRHLNSEPVVARPPSNLYRLGKLVRRNKTTFAAATAIVVTLVVGVVVSTWEAVRASRAEHEQARLRELAETKEKKSEQVAQFLKDMLQGVGPAVALGRDTELLREILDQTAERVGKDLKEQPEVEAELRSTIGNTYADLGDYPNAEAMHREALRLRRAVFGSRNELVADSLHDLGEVLRDRAEWAEAEAVHREALALRRVLLGNEHRDVAKSLNSLAVVFRTQKKYSQADPLYREALEMRRKLFGNQHQDVAESLNDLGVSLHYQGRFIEAEARYREALALFRLVYSNDHPALAISLNNIAAVLGNQNRMEESEKLHREALAMRQRLYGNEHPEVANSYRNLGNLLRDVGKFAEAETMQRDAVAIRKQFYGSDHPGVADSLYDLATVLEREDKLAQAETFAHEALALRRKIYGAAHLGVANPFTLLVKILRKAGKFDEAEGCWRELMQSLRGRPPDDPQLDRALGSWTQVLMDQKMFPEAEEVARERLQNLRLRFPENHPQLDGQLVMLTQILIDEGKFPEAEVIARESLANREKNQPDKWFISNTRSVLGGILVELKKHAQAEPLLLAGYEGLKQREETLPASGKVCLSNSMDRLVKFYDATGQLNKAAKWKQKLAEFDQAGK